MAFHRTALLTAGFIVFAGAPASAQLHATGVPELSSRPGAAYTIYIDPAGFNYNGTWIGSTPGNNLGLNGRGPGEAFTAGDVTEIKAIWAALSNQYRGVDVNITTVDPAIAAGMAGNDVQRQNFYDSQPRMMHTIIGPPGNDGWQGGADGLAGLGVIDSAQTIGSGLHTNWMFSQDVSFGSDVANGNYIGNIASHEGGHTFGLQHQGDFTGATHVNEYGLGDSFSGAGSYVGTMGNAYDRQRVTWRVGDAVDDFGNQFIQNDVAVIMGNSGMSFVDDGIGHTMGTATALAIDGAGNIDVTDSTHAGWINPLDAGNPQPIGSEHYTTDFFSFYSDGSTEISLVLNDGNDLLVAGIADNGATFRGMLTILDDAGNIIGTGTEDSSTMFTSFEDTLAAGQYFAQISSFGGHVQDAAAFNAAYYFDMGGYFLTGDGFVIPAPGTAVLISLMGVVATRRRRA
ncbi:MAG: hypothetical protein DHS20C14_01850 [Phycisphaeraceae bacterium]|nr:MAG: hypothetical protein DHS20C14_01850 [Phycisphaeraceae bacterium]